MLIQDNKTGTVHDISQLVSNIQVSTFLAGQPGKLTFDFVKSKENTVAFYEGSIVRLVVGETNVFYGYVFVKSRTKDLIISVTAYDQMRYLQNQDTMSYENISSSQVFERICGDYKFRHAVVSPSAYPLPEAAHDGKSLYAIIEDAIDRTWVATKQRFIIRDNFGTLEHIDMANLRTDFVIGDNEALTEYRYETSIDTDVYNQVKLVQEDKDKAKRTPYVVKDSENIARWGTLQYHEKVHESLNEAQIQERGEKLLSLYNTLRRKLRLDCLGDFRISAGSGILLAIKDLGDINLNQYCTVYSCVHKLENHMHTMNLEVEPIWRVSDL